MRACGNGGKPPPSGHGHGRDRWGWALLSPGLRSSLPPPPHAVGGIKFAEAGSVLDEVEGAADAGNPPSATTWEGRGPTGASMRRVWRGLARRKQQHRKLSTGSQPDEARRRRVPYSASLHRRRKLGARASLVASPDDDPPLSPHSKQCGRVLFA